MTRNTKLRIATGTVVLWAGCAAVTNHPTHTLSGTKPACEAEATITVTGDEPTPCDLGAGNTLVILGITEAECADAGGAWVYEACRDADF